MGGSLLEQEREVEGKELLLEGDRDVEGRGSVLTEVGRRKGRVGIPPGTGSGGSGEVPRRNKPGQSASPQKNPRAGTPSPTSHSPCSFFPLDFLLIFFFFVLILARGEVSSRGRFGGRGTGRCSAKKGGKILLKK